jgi:hypothetical protein
MEGHKAEAGSNPARSTSVFQISSLKSQIMIAIFCFLDSSGAPADGVYLFDTLEQADQWRVQVLLELNYGRLVDGKFILSIDATTNPPKEKAYNTPAELLEAFLDEACGIDEFFHEYQIHDNRSLP